MSVAQNSANAPSREKTSVTESTVTNDALDSAVAEAGAHPERAADLAKTLGIGPKIAPESVLHQALRCEGFPPPIFDGYFDVPPPGSFDAGVARVLGDRYHLDMVQWMRASHVSIQDSTPDVLGALQDEVKRSYGFARFAVMLANSIRMAQEEGDSQSEQQADAEREISRLAAVGFHAGWLMALEYAETKRHARATAGGAR